MMRSSLVLTSWLDSRRAMTMGPAALEERRSRLWRKLQPTLAQTPALQAHAGKPLADFPVIGAEQMRDDLFAHNSLGLGDGELRQMADLAEKGATAPSRGLAAGWSTGSGGTRGIFLTDERERARYLGQSLARLLPARRLLTGGRIALFLRANNALYSGVGRGRFHFAYFPLQGSLHDSLDRLKAFEPDILIAPSHILAGLAGMTAGLQGLKHCYYGAEPMGPAERNWIGKQLGVRPDPIYQATEGFLGAACRFGRLHLNDHDLQIELHPVEGTTCFRLTVTDLWRRSQPMVRVLLDDFIELDGGNCPCGFAGRTILPLQGRVGDLWRVAGRVVTPRTVTEIMENLVGPDAAWIAEASPEIVRIRVCEPAQGLDRMFQEKLHLRMPVEVTAGPVASGFPKRRRVRWSDHG